MNQARFTIKVLHHRVANKANIPPELLPVLFAHEPGIAMNLIAEILCEEIDALRWSK